MLTVLCVGAVAAQASSPRTVGISAEVGGSEVATLDYQLRKHLRIRALFSFRNVNPSTAGLSTFSTGLQVWSMSEASDRIRTLFGGGLRFGVTSAGPSAARDRMLVAEGFYGAEYSFAERFAVHGRLVLTLEDHDVPARTLFSAGSVLGLTWWLF